jgi:hypothetical protein
VGKSSSSNRILTSYGVFIARESSQANLIYMGFYEDSLKIKGAGKFSLNLRFIVMIKILFKFKAWLQRSISRPVCQQTG